MVQFSNDSFVEEEIDEMELNLLSKVDKLYTATEDFLKTNELTVRENEYYLPYNIQSTVGLQNLMQSTHFLPNVTDLLDDQYIHVNCSLYIENKKTEEKSKPFYHCKLYLYRPEKTIHIFEHEFKELIEKGFVREANEKEKIKYKLKQ